MCIWLGPALSNSAVRALAVRYADVSTLYGAHAACRLLYDVAHAAQHECAIDKFDAARELAGLVSRGSLDVTARRNAAACLNNKGVCQSVGTRSARKSPP